MYRKNEIQLCPSPLYKCIVILVAAATLILTACGGLNGDDGEKNIRINLPPIEQSASGNSRALSDDRLPMLKTETKRYRVTVNDIVREGTESSYEFTLPVGIRATAIIECLNSSGEVIIRAVKDFTVSSGENSVDINLKNDGNEIMPASAAGRVTYSYGEADRHGNKSGIPSDPTTYSEGDLFEVKDGSGMTWDHATQQSGFAGWSASPAIEPENGGQEESSPTSGQKYKMPRGGVTLTAQWNKKSYTITYDMNAAGSGNTSSSTSINQGSVQALEDYTIDSTTPASVSAGGKNYTFMEWSDGNGNTYAVGGKITNVTGNITLMAQWSDEDVWTVTYEKGSTQASTQDITNWIASDNAVDGNSVTLPTLQAAGYTFTGWRIDGATQQGGTSYTPTVSVTATAQWTVNSYQVTYALDGGSGGPASGNVQYNASVALDAPTKTGYNFTGWSDGSTTYGGTSGNSSLTMPAQAITLTAQWTAAQYNITYYDVDASSASTAFSGTNATSFQTTHTYGTTTTLTDGVKVTVTDVVRAFKFLGWFTDNTGNGATVTTLGATDYTADINLYAKWEELYTLTLNINGGSWANASDDKTQYSASDLPLTLPTPTAPSGFTFAGWADNTILSGVQNSVTITSGTTGNKTYYAVYKTSSTSNNAATTSSATGSIEFVAVQGGTVPLAANYMPVVSNFSMGKYEITRKQWQNVMQDFPSWMITPTGNADNNPVDSISWYAAIAFCNKLSIMENKNPCYSVRVSGQEVDWANIAFADIPTAVNTDWDAATCDMNQNGYRLPTEAEWEYAARGGINHSPYEYSGSDTVDDVAWYASNSSNVTNEVGQKAPNALTIYDMSGNLAEWCWDWYNYSYETSVTNNPTGVSTGSGRVRRGGDRSSSNTDYLKVSERSNNDPTTGFTLRIVCRP